MTWHDMGWNKRLNRIMELNALHDMTRHGMEWNKITMTWHDIWTWHEIMATRHRMEWNDTGASWHKSMIHGYDMWYMDIMTLGHDEDARTWRLHHARWTMHTADVKGGKSDVMWCDVMGDWCDVWVMWCDVCWWWLDGDEHANGKTRPWHNMHDMICIVWMIVIIVIKLYQSVQKRDKKGIWWE